MHYVQGVPEVIYIDVDTVLIINEAARELHLPKNKEASKYWFAKNSCDDYAGDFILGDAIYCSSKLIEGTDTIYSAPSKPPISKEERRKRIMEDYVENQNKPAPAVAYTPNKSAEAAAMQCSLDSPEGCEACGS